MNAIQNATIQDIWNTIGQQLEANRDPYAHLNAVYEFQLLDEGKDVYQLVLNNGTVEIHALHKKESDCTLKMKEKYFRKFLLGDLNSTTAFMTGKLKVDGNIGLALKLENMLKQYDFSN